MQRRCKKSSTKEQLEDAILEIGGEPLEGSGFENETPDPESSDAAVLRATMLPLRPNVSH